MSKVLFLDFDGVLNSQVWFGGTEFRERRDARRACRGEVAHDQRKAREHIDPVAIHHIQRIIDETGAGIVVSSVWRLGRDVRRMQKILTIAGLRANVLGLTPDYQEDEIIQRSDEIRGWLFAHPKVTTWCALDDGVSAGPHRLVLVDDRVGLTSWDADDAIRLLADHQTPAEEDRLHERLACRFDARAALVRAFAERPR